MSTIKSYKGFNKDMTCRDFKYEVGKEYETDRIKLCETGFHACEHPLDVWDYYPPVGGNRFCEVKQSGKKETDGTKTVSSKIKIGAEIGIAGLVKAHIEWISEQTRDIVYKVLSPLKAISESKDEAQIGSSGNGAQIGSSGNWAKIGSSGNWAQIGSSGDEAKIGSSGNWAQIGSSGNWAKIGSSGNWAKIGSSGDEAKIGSSGNWAQIGSSGNWAKIGSSGDGAQIGSSGNVVQIGSSGNGAKIECTGNNSVVACAGRNNLVKAPIGTWICLSEFDDTGICIGMKAFKIDGKKYPADTWLKIKNGKIVKA